MRLEACFQSPFIFVNFITMSMPKQCNDFTERAWAQITAKTEIGVRETSFHLKPFVIIGKNFGGRRFQEETPEAAFRGRERGLQAFTFNNYRFKPILNTYAI